MILEKRLKEKHLQEGRQEGRQKGRQELAQEMLAKMQETGNPPTEQELQELAKGRSS